MGLEQNNEQHYREVVDKFCDPVVSYQMTTRDYVVRPSALTGAITLTLPPVAEAKGRWYSIIARSVAGGNITIEDKDDSECWPGDVLLDAICDRALLYSDGLTWWVFTGAGQSSRTTAAPTTEQIIG